MSMHTPPDDTGLSILRQNLESYLEGATGVEYEDLVSFAEPLFDLFDLDLRSARCNAEEREAEETATLLSLLDLARLFWAYFLLDESQSESAQQELSHALLGANPSQEDIIALVQLIEMLEDQWLSLPSNGSPSTTGYALPPFSELLRDYVRTRGSHSQDSEGQGARSDLPDVLASFARPLFEAANLDDPSEIDDALARAQAYWELAQTTGNAYEQRLSRLARRFATSVRSEEEIRQEALAMTRRFRDLFG